MISAILFDSNEEELNKIEDFVSDAVSMLAEDELRIAAFSSVEKLKGGMETLDLCDVVVAEFGEDGSCVDIIRKKFGNIPLLLVVDITVSPAKYIRPGIMPSALILRPSSDDDMERNISDFLSASLKPTVADDEQMLMVETKFGDLKVPISKVVYFESKAKKVFLRLKNEEYGYYDTLEHLEATLPDNFVRCHRGIIVNMDYVERYATTEKTLYLKDDIFIPVSRSYNAAVRGKFKK